MSTGRDEMIAAIKEHVIPEIRNKKFKGSFPHFRKTENGKTNLITFQFDRDGGGFIIELANTEEQEFHTSWGKVIPLNKLTAHDLHKRQRIYPYTVAEVDGKNSWFRYDNSESLQVYDGVAQLVLNRISLMEQYWTEGVVRELEVNEPKSSKSLEKPKGFKERFTKLFFKKKRP